MLFNSFHRSFDFEVELKNGMVHTFSSIEKEEYHKLFDFITDKKLRVKNRGKMVHNYFYLYLFNLRNCEIELQQVWFNFCRTNPHIPAILKIPMLKRNQMLILLVSKLRRKNGVMMKMNLPKMRITIRTRISISRKGMTGK